MVFLDLSRKPRADRSVTPQQQTASLSLHNIATKSGVSIMSKKRKQRSSSEGKGFGIPRHHSKAIDADHLFREAQEGLRANPTRIFELLSIIAHADQFMSADGGEPLVLGRKWTAEDMRRSVAAIESFLQVRSTQNEEDLRN